MSVELHDGYADVYKFHSTGILPLFAETKSFIIEERNRSGRFWKPIDIQNDRENKVYYVRLVETTHEDWVDNVVLDLLG